MFKTVALFSTALTALMVLGGCSAKDTSKIKEEIVIPGPPDEPRLHFLNSYYGNNDFMKRTALDTLIGEMPEELIRRLNKPYGVAAKNGKIYVSDTTMGVVFVFDTIAEKVTYLGQTASGKLALPLGIAFDKEGNVYVSDAKIKRIYVYDIKGNFVRVIGEKGEFIRPTGIAINESTGVLYAIDTLSHHVKMFSLDGRFIGTFGKRGNGDGDFNYPTNIDIDRRNGNIIIGDTQNFRVQIFDKDGRFLGKFGQLGDKPGMFARPKGVAVDSEGHIYAVDSAFNNIQVFDEKGNLLMYFGGTGNTPGTFQLPSGISFDENDRLYTTEGYNARVQVFQYMSEEWKRKHPDEFKRLKTPSIK